MLVGCINTSRHGLNVEIAVAPIPVGLPRNISEISHQGFAFVSGKQTRLQIETFLVSNILESLAFSHEIDTGHTLSIFGVVTQALAIVGRSDKILVACKEGTP
jgi:hypothetical protein